MSAPPAAEAFVTYAVGKLKVFNSAKNFGFISPVHRPEGSEGPPLDLGTEEGLWFFANHSLPQKAQLGLSVSLEVWENSEGKPQARCVKVDEGSLAILAEKCPVVNRHPHEPKMIYPSVYISDVPVEYTEDTLRELHRSLGLDPESIMGLKFLPFTELSMTNVDLVASAAPATGAVILRYRDEEAANGTVERLNGHPVRTSAGATKYLAVRHAAPAKWMVERKIAEDDEKKHVKNQGEALLQRIRGVVARVSAAGYGVIKSHNWGEVMWRQYELPTNLRSMQFANADRFQKEVQSRADYQRLKDMEGKDVEADLHRLPDGQLRASKVKLVAPTLGDRPLLAIGSAAALGSAADARLALPSDGARADGVVLVKPLPQHWSSAELRERFEWYGNLIEANVERRIYDESMGGTAGRSPGVPPPADGASVSSLGVLVFDDPRAAQEVVSREHGGDLDGKGVEVTVEAGVPRRLLGWCEGVVMRYLPRYGVGLMRSAQVDGDVHFEAPPDVRLAGLDLQGCRVDAKVSYGGDGAAQASEVRAKDGGFAVASKGSTAPVKQEGEVGESGSPAKSRKRKAGDAGEIDPRHANDPFYKTQPCPYYRQGQCQQGNRCYFAHRPDELRAHPEAVMMGKMMEMMPVNQMMMGPPGSMMLGQAPAPGDKKRKDKKDKKDKDKDKKRRRKDKAEGSESDSHGSSAVRADGRGVDSGRRHGPGNKESRGSASSRKKRKVHLDDRDF